VSVLALAYFLIIRYNTQQFTLPENVAQAEVNNLDILVLIEEKILGPTKHFQQTLLRSEHDRSVTNIQLIDGFAIVHRKLAKAKVVTLSPGARCSWHEPLHTHKELRKQLHTLANKCGSNDIHLIQYMPRLLPRHEVLQADVAVVDCGSPKGL